MTVLSNKTNSEIRYLNTKYNTGCHHQWVYDGHGHNYDVYKCSKCGIEGKY